MEEKTVFSYCKLLQILIEYSRLVYPVLGDEFMSNKKKEISAQSNHEDELLSRALLWIGGAAILIMLLLLANRFYINYRADEIMLAYNLIKVFNILGVAGIAVGVAGGVMAWTAFKKQAPCKWWVALSAFFSTFGVMLIVVRHLRELGVQVMCAVIPVAAVLALVYYLYQREFFLSALASALGMLGLWMFRKLAGHAVALYAVLAMVAVALVVIALFTRQVQNGEGMWKDKRILSKNAAYHMVYITCIVIAALLVLALFVGKLAFYLMFPAIAWLVVMTVYFTVKLM